jgi:arabinose-5-phosphate isomerase
LDKEEQVALVEAARRVIRLEAEALTVLGQSLPEDFAVAVSLILETQGRVIVSGMGKSGHIGCKISATLASTGTPAFFVHPAEASHGDLGMVMPGDVCLLISNSGETAELGDIIAHCARFSIPVIGVSSRQNSTLMRACRARLILPPLAEACPNGLAPTTSTTMMLALGDALAVALMEQRSFRPDQFRTYHPGGKLGARLATVAQLMHGADSLPLVPESAAMSDVLLVMTSHGFGVAGVTDADGRLVGMISDGDLRRNMEGLMDRSAGDVATRNPVVIQAETLAAEALAVMNARKISVLMVANLEGRAIGILHIHDCLRAGVA